MPVDAVSRHGAWSAPAPGSLVPAVPLLPDQARSLRLEVDRGLLRLRSRWQDHRWRVGEDVDGVWWDGSSDVAVLSRRGVAVAGLSGEDWGRRHLEAALATAAVPTAGPPDGAARVAASHSAAWVRTGLPVLTLIGYVGLLSPALTIAVLGVARLGNDATDMSGYLRGAHGAFAVLGLTALVWVWTVFVPPRGPRPPGVQLLRPRRRWGPGARARVQLTEDAILLLTDDRRELYLPLRGPQRVASASVVQQPVPGGWALVLADPTDRAVAVLPLDPWFHDVSDARSAADTIRTRSSLRTGRPPLLDPAAPVIGAPSGVVLFAVATTVTSVALAGTGVVPLLLRDCSPLSTLSTTVALLLLPSLALTSGLRIADAVVVMRAPTRAEGPDRAAQPADHLDETHETGRAVDSSARQGCVTVLAPLLALGLVVWWWSFPPQVPASVLEQVRTALMLLLSVVCLVQAGLLLHHVLETPRSRRRLLADPGLVAAAVPTARLGPDRFLVATDGALVEHDLVTETELTIRTGPDAVTGVLLPEPPPGERGDLVLCDASGRPVHALNGEEWFPTQGSRRAAAARLHVLAGTTELSPDTVVSYELDVRGPVSGGWLLGVVGAVLGVTPWVVIGYVPFLLAPPGALGVLAMTCGAALGVVAAVLVVLTTLGTVRPRHPRHPRHPPPTRREEEVR